MTTRPEGLFMCCGTTCAAQANLEYTLELEQTVEGHERTIRLLRRKVERRIVLIDELDEQNNKLVSRNAELEELLHELIEGDTTGAT